MSVVDTRFGHTEGRVCLAYNEKNNKIVSVGSDGEMRVWSGNVPQHDDILDNAACEGIDDDDCENTLIGDEVLAMAASTAKIFTGVAGTNVLSGYNWDGEGEGVVGPRFSADVTALACTSSGDTVVAGGADFSVKVINTSSFATVSLAGHSAPVLSVAISSRGDTVASSSCDGSVRLWSVASKTQLQLLDSCHARTNDVPHSPTVAGLSFSRGGDEVAVVAGGAVAVLAREGGWAPPGRRCDLGLPQGELATCLAWDADTRYLVAATNKGNLCIISYPELKLVKTISSGRKHNICSIVAHPENNEVIFADLGGHWGLLENIEVSGGSAKTDAAVANADAEDMEALFNDDDDDENSFSVSKVAAQAGYTKDADGNLTFSGDQLPGDSAAEDGERPSSALSVATPTPRERPAPVARAVLQPPFQPGASPAGLANRFLVYNSAGVIKSHESEQERSVDIEFHDSATHHSLHLANSEGWTMAALSHTLLALASPGDKAEETEARLTVNYFSSSDLNKEWSLAMDKEEEIVGVAVGGAWVAVASSNMMLRFFTAGGMQREVVMLAGPLVTMVGEEDRLLVVTHTGLAQLAYTLYTVGGAGVVPAHAAAPSLPLPLGPGTQLYWAGFSDTRTPVATDTGGVTRALDPDTWLWHPVLRSRDHVRGHSDFHYLISVSHTDWVARTVLCKGTKYPPTVPRPLPVALPLEAPLLSLQSEKGGLEQTSINLQLQSKFLSSCPRQTDEVTESLDSVRQKEIETIMKLFALACKSDHESRALEVARLLPSVDTVQLAIQYAAKMRRTGLAERLGKLAMQRQEQEDIMEAEAEAGRGDVADTDDESQDMFEATQENPLLAAAARRDNLGTKGVTNNLNITSQGKQESRNPFAKKIGVSGTMGSPSQSGIVFDSLKSNKSSAAANGGKEVSGFGQRKIVLNTQDKVKKPAKQPLIQKEKENKPDNNGETLKGFQLYFAENRGSVPDEAAALSEWKGLEKAAKEQYQVARVPRPGDCGKRKRSEDAEAEEEGKKLKTGSAKQKLAGFAFS